jgi:ketosteroid isomerase-like protein
VTAPTNLELVRAIFAAWQRGDYSTADWADPGIESVMVDGPDPGSWSGVPAMADANRDFLGAWNDWRIEAEDFRELDGERILVLTRRAGRGKRSGLQVSEPAANLIHLRDGRVTRLVFYWERDRALSDLDLSAGADT